MAIIHRETYSDTPTTQDDCIKSLLYGHDIISMHDLAFAQIQQILDLAKVLKHSPIKPQLAGKIILHCFFEPSTRTRLSFEAATLRLGGKVIGFSSGESLSIQKGESLQDTMRVISSYCDLIILRHPKEGSARLAAEVSNKPVINGGDGANQHPTQALIDLFTIAESQQQMNGLSIALVGDLKYGRVIHSLVELCMHYDIRLFLVAPQTLTLSEILCDKLKKHGVRFSFHPNLQEVLPKVDILYMTRIQQERMNHPIHHPFILNAEMLKMVKPNLKILHPLPRLHEITADVDQTQHANYFEQAENGIYIRQALLSLILNNKVVL